MSKILVTGGCGFIGSHIVDMYVALGHEVVVVDKQRTPYMNKKAHYVIAGLEYALDDKKLLEGVEVINHHAAQVDVRTSNGSPTLDAYQNIIITLKLLEAATKNNVKRFIYAASAGASYGLDKGQISPYALSKDAAAQYVEWFRTFHGLETVTLCYSNVYGPRQTKGVIPLFIAKTLNGRPCILNGGEQTRDFIYVADVVGANISALTTDPRTYVLAAGISTPIKDLCVQIHELCGQQIRISSADYIKGEVKECILQPSGPAGWAPEISLEEGLRRTIRHKREFSHID